MFAEILARFAAEHVCNLKEVKTPQSTLCSDLDDPYLAATPGETIWSSRDVSDPKGASVPSRLWTSSMLRTIRPALIPHPVLKLPEEAGRACRRGVSAHRRNIRGRTARG